jgi:hypothetical protein
MMGLAIPHALRAIDPLTALSVLLATAAIDAVYVMFSSAVAVRRRLPAVTWSSVVPAVVLRCH